MIHIASVTLLCLRIVLCIYNKGCDWMCNEVMEMLKDLNIAGSFGEDLIRRLYNI